MGGITPRVWVTEAARGMSACSQSSAACEALFQLAQEGWCQPPLSAVGTPSATMPS